MEYVKIIKCSNSSYWYKDQIGKLFVSYHKKDPEGYIVKATDGYLNFIFDGDYEVVTKKTYTIKSCSIPFLWYASEIGGAFTNRSIMHETNSAVWLSKEFTGEDNAWIYKKDLEVINVQI